jgi:signal transduction histidine kinase
LCQPIVRLGNLTGVVYLENSQMAGAFTPQRVHVVEVLSAQAGVSLENARLYDELEQRVQIRTRELRDAQARLVRLERDATEAKMAGGFAHEMRNALAGTKMVVYKALGRLNVPERGIPAIRAEALRLLRERFEPMLPADARPGFAHVVHQLAETDRQLSAILGVIAEGAERALGVTERILEYAQLGKENPGQAPFSVGEVARQVVAALTERAAPFEVGMAFDGADTMRGSPKHFRQLLSQLVANSIDAMESSGPHRAKRIDISGRRTDGRYELKVQDSGCGIRESDLPRVFEPFFSTNPSTGRGLGLSMASKITSLYGGNIRLESRLGEGTTVTVSFPVRDGADGEVTQLGGPSPARSEPDWPRSSIST